MREPEEYRIIIKVAADQRMNVDIGESVLSDERRKEYAILMGKATAMIASGIDFGDSYRPPWDWTVRGDIKTLLSHISLRIKWLAQDIFRKAAKDR